MTGRFEALWNEFASSSLRDVPPDQKEAAKYIFYAGAIAFGKAERNVIGEAERAGAVHAASAEITELAHELSTFVMAQYGAKTKQ